jgi:hypothetical protein
VSEATTSAAERDAQILASIARMRTDDAYAADCYDAAARELRSYAEGKTDPAHRARLADIGSDIARRAAKLRRRIDFAKLDFGWLDLLWPPCSWCIKTYGVSVAHESFQLVGADRWLLEGCAAEHAKRWPSERIFRARIEAIANDFDADQAPEYGWSLTLPQDLANRSCSGVVDSSHWLARHRVLECVMDIRRSGKRDFDEILIVEYGPALVRPSS